MTKKQIIKRARELERMVERLQAKADEFAKILEYSKTTLYVEDLIWELKSMVNPDFGDMIDNFENDEDEENE